MDLYKDKRVHSILGVFIVLFVFSVVLYHHGNGLLKTVIPCSVLNNGASASDHRGLYEAGTRPDGPRYNRHAIVCMIFTTPNNWETKGRAVRVTWATRCPYVLIFYSNSSASEGHAIRKANNTVGLDTPDGRTVQTQKTLAAMRYSVAKYGDVAEWFMKADDDSYVVWENLEKLLDEYATRNVSYIGHRAIVSELPNGYTIGGCYLVRRKVVDLVIDDGKKFPTQCHQAGEGEDVDIGRCLAHFGIYPTDTRDQFGKERFHQENPMRLMDEESTHSARINFAGVTIGNPKSDREWLSPETVTFHHVSPGNILMFDYLLYHMHRDGRQPQQFIKLTKHGRRQ